MFNGIQNKGCCDNNPVNSNFIHWKLIFFNEINEDIISDKKKSLIYKLLKVYSLLQFRHQSQW